MSHRQAFLNAVKMYLVIGLVVASVHTLGFHAISGDTALDRSLALAGDVVGWPRFLVLAVQNADARVMAMMG